MSLDDFATVTIDTTSANPSVPGFNVPLILVQKLPAGWTVGRVRTYTDLASLVTDGWTVNDPAYLAVQAAFSQNPRPPAVKLGARRTNKTSQVVKLKCLSAVEGDVYRITLVTPAGVSTTISYTVPGAATTTTVATAILALINAVSGFSGSTSSTDTITVASPTAGTQNRFKNWTINFTFSDQSTDPGIATDLAAVLAEDSDWSGLQIDTIAKAEILAAAAFCEANKKLFTPQSCDTDIGDVAVTTDVASTVVTNAYRFTSVLFGQNDTQAFGGVAWMCGRYAATPIPGDETWAFKTLSGVATDTLTQGQINAATSATKRATVYVTQNAVNITQSGTSGQVGSGEWIDVVRGVEWIRITTQIRLFGRMVNAPKVPYTDAGADSLAGTVESVLKEAVGYSILDSYTSPTGPKVSSIDSSTRQQRIYGTIAGSGRLAGAIHKANVRLAISA